MVSTNSRSFSGGLATLRSIDLTSFMYSALASSDVVPLIEFHASHLAFSLLKGLRPPGL